MFKFAVNQMKILNNGMGPIAYMSQSPWWTNPIRWREYSICYLCDRLHPETVVLHGVLYPPTFEPLRNLICVDCIQKYRCYKPGKDELDRVVEGMEAKRVRQIRRILTQPLPSNLCKIVLSYFTDGSTYATHVIDHDRQSTISRFVVEILPDDIARLVAAMSMGSSARKTLT